MSCRSLSQDTKVIRRNTISESQTNYIISDQLTTSFIISSVRRSVQIVDYPWRLACVTMYCSFLSFHSIFYQQEINRINDHPSWSSASSSFLSSSQSQSLVIPPTQLCFVVLCLWFHPIKTEQSGTTKRIKEHRNHNLTYCYWETRWYCSCWSWSAIWSCTSVWFVVLVVMDKFVVKIRPKLSKVSTSELKL